MRTFVIALTLVSLTVPALSQGARGSMPPAQKTKDPPKAKADDKEYNAALDRLPAQKYDAWRTVRPDADAGAKKQ